MQIQLEAAFEGVAFSPNSKYLAVGYTDGTITLWNIALKQKILEVTQGAKIKGISFSPDSEVLVLCSVDGTFSPLGHLFGTSTFTYKGGSAR